MACTRIVHQAAFAFCCFAFVSAFAAEPREITGTLVQPKTHSPIAGQKLVLDRAAGDYTHVPFAMLLFGTPQPVVIGSAVTDSHGRFRFVTQKDRGRFLTVRIYGVALSDFRSRRDYAVERLRDSLHTDKPRVDFDAQIMHNPRGGFISIP
jgi:hypothetical protein